MIDDTKAAAAELLDWAASYVEGPWQSITVSVKLADGVVVGIRVPGGKSP